MLSTMKNRSFLFTISTLLVTLLVITACDIPGQLTSPAGEATVEEATVEETVAEPEAEPTEAAVEEAENTESEAATADVGEPQTFAIIQEGTEARFRINEVLRGSDFEVVGVTSMVTGEITINPADLSQTEIGTIQIDARDFATDSGRRDTAIRRFVLRSAAEETRYITFIPTAIEGLPDSAAAGETVTFQVTGDLTIRTTTNPVTFDMTVTANAESEISGTGTTTILYPDYGISIPSVPFVASVEDEVTLEINFMATAQ